MNKNTLAKIAGWIGSLLVAGSSAFGKYASAATAVGGILVGLGVHTASNTSAGHPNG